MKDKKDSARFQNIYESAMRRNSQSAVVRFHAFCTPDRQHAILREVMNLLGQEHKICHVSTESLDTPEHGNTCKNMFLVSFIGSPQIVLDALNGNIWIKSARLASK